MTEDGWRCTRTRTPRTLGDSAFAVGVNLLSPPPSPPPLSCESLALLFSRVRRAVGCEGVHAGVGEVRGSDFEPIYSRRPRNCGQVLSFMRERSAILGANASDRFQCLGPIPDDGI